MTFMEEKGVDKIEIFVDDFPDSAISRILK